MIATDWLVIVAGATAVAWVNWYFFFAEQRVAVAISAPAAAHTPATLEATIVVRGGYSPAAVRVEAGRPVRLIFDRQETSGCSEEVVFPDFGIRRFLPAHQQTAVELTPQAAGSYEFTCGMGMLRGKIVAT